MILKKSKFSKKLIRRRGVSQIFGSIIMLAIVASVGSVLLFQGLNAINEFNLIGNSFLNINVASVQESLVISHVRLDPLSDQVEITIRNTGVLVTYIDTITMVKVDTQNLILNEYYQQTSIPVNYYVEIIKTALLSEGTAQWDDPYYNSSFYQISITTTNGNSFTTVVAPYNT